MINLVITYNIDNASNRTEFVETFEKILLGMKLNKEFTNQSTYYGAYRTKEDFLTDLFNATNKMIWGENDVVTIYYPKVQSAKPKNLADIGRHEFKSEGSKVLNHIIFKA